MITFEDTVAQLQAIVKERPGHSYRPSGADRICRYADNHPGAGLVPGCLLGQWLHRFHRIGLEELYSLTGYNIERVLPDLIFEGKIEEPDDRLRLIRFLGLVQELQDNGVPWGQSLRWGIAKIERVLPVLRVAA